MNGYGHNGKDRQALNGILTLLLALAALAETAAGRSQPVRRIVFFLLVPAEAVARDLLDGIEWDLQPLTRDGDSPADLLHLAQSFRALAGLLDHFLAACPAIAAVGPPDLAAMALTAYLHVLPALYGAALRQPAPDTS